MLGIGAIVAVVAFLGHRSNEWEVATTAWKGRMVEYGSWAGGAFAIGIGVLPAIALLAALAVPASERARPGVRAFVVVSGGAVVSFGWYAAIKGAYLSTTFSSLVVERNLVYLSPLAFVATAYLLERAAAPAWAVVVAGAAVLGLIVWVPIDRGLDNFPYYEAHGLAILALANREWAWPLGRIETAVELLTLASVVLLLLLGTPLRARVATVAAPVAVAVAIALVGWNLTAEVYASIGEHDFSALVERNIPKPNDWVDRAADGGTVVMLGQRMSDDPLGVPSTEFWNRSIVKVWSVDGTGPGPGHTLTPDLQDIDGTLWPDPETDFVLTSGGVEVVGEQVATNAGSALVRLDGPIRLRSNQTGIAADGWILGDPGDESVPARAAYNRFDVSDGGTGRAVVTLSRETFCPEGVRLPGIARVRIGELGRGSDKQPAIARETASETVYVPACGGANDRPPHAGRPVARRGRHRDLRAGEGRSAELGRRAPRARGAGVVRRRSALAADGCDDVREPRAQREPCEGPGPLGGLQQADRGARQPAGLRDEERPQLDAREARAEELGHDVVHPVLARVEVEHELALREPRHPCEERATVARVVDRPEDRGGRDRPGRLVEVQVALCDRGRVAEPAPRGLDHRRLCVDSGVAQSALEEERPEPAVAAGEVEHLVARVERDAERRDQLGAVREVGPRVRVLGIRPIGGLARVLVGLAPGRAHSRASVSGCSRTKRAMLRACQTV